MKIKLLHIFYAHRGPEPSGWHLDSVKLLFEPHDLWVGLFWKRERTLFGNWLTFYLALIPTLPLRIEFHEIHGEILP